MGTTSTGKWGFWTAWSCENEDFEQPDHVSTEIPLFGTNLVSNSELNMLYTTSLQMLCRKGISMLTGLKVSSLACKCVFYRPKYMDFSFSFFFIFIFTTRVMVTKMFTIAPFYIFYSWQQKVNHSLGEMFKCIWSILLSFSENSMDYWVLSYYTGYW